MSQFIAGYLPLFDLYLLHLGLAFSQYIVLRAGVFSLATAAFAGIGAYTAGIFAVKLGMHPVLGLAAGTLTGMGAALFLSIPLARLRGVYQAIATVAFIQIVVSLKIFSEGLTGGGRIGTMDCSIAPLTEPDMRTTHPALWIGPSKCQLKLGRYLRGVKFHPSGFQRYQSSCEPGNRIGPRHARTVGLVPNTPAAIRGTGGSPAARPHCQKMPEKEAGSLLLTHDDSSQPTADMSVEYTQSLDTLFRAEPEVRHPPVEVAAETRHTR